jgi:hypothetical protein
VFRTVGCGCLLVLAAWISPRLAVLLLWLLTSRMSVAFDRFWIAAVGFFLLPWTTLAWAVAYAAGHGVRGFGWILVVVALLADLSTHAGSAEARRERRDRRRRAHS